MAQLVECIPNFSDARRPEIIDKIKQAIQTVPEIIILDQHSDLDHNRTVITFLGPPQQVETAAFNAISEAAKWINLDEHTGEHPRIGATDVVPFVPISEISMEDCVAMGKRLGQRVAQELNIPVYLYEEAAERPDRKNLEDIRRGQYEALKTEIKTNPYRQPDFGPNELGAAGATVIGARFPLIAYNIYLTTDDVSIAQKIAKAVRHSSGGLRFVKAMGVLVDGRAQVSMNLTNFRKTPLARVVELIRSEAKRFGTAIHHSELVGLIPQEALIDSAIWYTQLDGFESAQILESHIFDALTNGSANADFLDLLASAEPVPGGGSAGAHTAAASAALVAMVARLTVGRKKYAEVDSLMQQAIVLAEDLRAKLTQAVHDDAAAFTSYMNALKLPKDTPEQINARTTAIQRGVIESIAVPLSVLEMCTQLLELTVQAASLGNVNAISDAGTAGCLAFAALQSASMNVQINLQNLTDADLSVQYQQKLEKCHGQAQQLQQELKKIMKERANIELFQ
jgi:glutamate formiminotransferase/formiminotetrahydrofolate cyclodeaminase